MKSAAKTGWACGLYLCPHQPKCEFREPTDEQPAACAHGKHLWVTIGRWLVRCDNCGLSGRLMWDGRVKAGERVYAGR